MFLNVLFGMVLMPQEMGRCCGLHSNIVFRMQSSCLDKEPKGKSSVSSCAGLRFEFDGPSTPSNQKVNFGKSKAPQYP